MLSSDNSYPELSQPASYKPEAQASGKCPSQPASYKPECKRVVNVHPNPPHISPERKRVGVQPRFARQVSHVFSVWTTVRSPRSSL